MENITELKARGFDLTVKLQQIQKEFDATVAEMNEIALRIAELEKKEMADND